MKNTIQSNLVLVNGMPAAQFFDYFLEHLELRMPKPEMSSSGLSIAGSKQ